MRKIFISYRRSDGEYAAGALGRDLRNYFGEDQVFRDKEDVGGGVAWKQHLLHEIDRDSALLVLIGREWLNVKDAHGRRRLDNPDDPLRLEIADGLKDGAAIFPVLLENARMPDETELPPDLQRLAELNALSLRDSDWTYDMTKIRKTLERVGFAAVGAKAAAPEARPAEPAPAQDAKGFSVKGIVGAVIVVASFAALGSNDLGDDGRLGVGILAAVAFALGILSWRDTRKMRSSWRFLAVAVCALSVLAGFGIIGSKEAEKERARNGGSQASARETPIATRGNGSVPVDQPADGRSQPGDSRSVLPLLKGHAVVRFDPTSWKRKEDASLEAGEYLFLHSEGDLYVKLITERMAFGTENLANLGLTNAKSVDAAAKVTRRGMREINGLELAFREIELTVNGVPVTYYAHYFSDAVGSIQIVGYTSRQLMKEYRGTVEDFVAGFSVPRTTE